MGKSQISFSLAGSKDRGLRSFFFSPKKSLNWSHAGLAGTCRELTLAPRCSNALGARGDWKSIQRTLLLQAGGTHLGGLDGSKKDFGEQGSKEIHLIRFIQMLWFCSTCLFGTVCFALWIHRATMASSEDHAADQSSSAQCWGNGREA